MSPGQRQSSIEDDAVDQSQESGQASKPHPLAEELLQWYTQHGGWLSPDVHILFSQARGFHMRARKAASSPNVASCPLKLTLSRLNLDVNQKEIIHIDSCLQQCRGKIPDHILTHLLLIEQRNKGKDSPWHPYIACLPAPEDMTTPLWFDQEDFAFLAGTSLAPAAKERKAEMRRQWEQAIHVMREAGIAMADEIHFELLLWAATIFTSRAFISTHILPDQETTPILFPVIDILNHSVSAKVEWDFQPYHSFTLKCLDAPNFKPGDELFNNYAPKQNDELLLGYGFCLPSNPIEQFALKLAFPPMLLEHAQEIGLLRPENVPFGMSPSFLANDPNNEQHFLRPKGHPFGRYENNVPFFRGIPPYIIHFFFIQCLLSQDIAISSLTPAHPGQLVTFKVLNFLHQAISQRAATLPLTTPLTPKNSKQAYAKSYRDQQATIIHSISTELRAAISSLLLPLRPGTTTTTPLLSLPDGLSTLNTLFPTHSQHFTSALQTSQLPNNTNNPLPWTLLLTTFLLLTLTQPQPQPPTSTSTSTSTSSPSFLSLLLKSHPLPPLEQGIDDPDTYSYIDENLSLFVRPSAPSDSHKSASEPESPLEILDDMDLADITRRLGGETARVFLQAGTENISVRVVMWAMSVVGERGVGVEGQEGMYVFVGGEDERWMYDDDDDDDDDDGEDAGNHGGEVV